MDDAVAGRDDTRSGRDINAGGAVADGIEEQGIEHMDALGDDHSLAAALHGGVAAGAVVGKVVPRHLHRLAVRQPVDGVKQQLPVDAQGRLPVGQVLWPLGERQKEIVHAQQADLDAQIFEIRLQAHRRRRLAGAGGAGQADEGLARLCAQDRGGSGADLVVKDLLTAQNELRLVPHGIDNVFNINNPHFFPPYVCSTAPSCGGRSEQSRARAPRLSRPS